VVPIFTYRDERKLFAVIGAIIVAALIALIQISAAHSGKPSFLSQTVSTLVGVVQNAVSGTVDAARGAAGSLADLPHLRAQNVQLKADNAALARQNAALTEALSQAPEAAALARASAAEPNGIAARAIGFDPENQARIATLNKGSQAGVERDAGVINEDGVVGRVVEVEAFTSRVLLLTDPASKVPAIVQHGRWWGIATGTSSRVQLQFVSQDARLRPGDLVVTGEGRSFHAGLPLGRIVQVAHPEGALYQTATVEPAVAFGRLDRVLVIPR
jgi:rod shape-determining protein MreC